MKEKYCQQKNSTENQKVHIFQQFCYFDCDCRGDNMTLTDNVISCIEKSSINL